MSQVLCYGLKFNMLFELKISGVKTSYSMGERQDCRVDRKPSQEDFQSGAVSPFNLSSVLLKPLAVKHQGFLVVIFVIWFHEKLLAWISSMENLCVWQNWVKYYKDLCFYCSLCDKLATGRGLATSEARKFFLKERENFSYPGNFEAKRIFICHVCWNTKQTEKCEMLV